MQKYYSGIKEVNISVSYLKIILKLFNVKNMI